MMADDDVDAPFGHLLGQIPLPVGRGEGILIPPVDVHDDDIRRFIRPFDLRLEPGKAGIIQRLVDYDLRARRQRQAVGQFGHPKESEGNPVHLFQPGGLVVRLILIDAGR